jgi:hypothetical protein
VSPIHQELAMQTILIQDQSIDGRNSATKTLTLLAEEITVREIIRSRVYQEVQDYNLRCDGTFQGLVQPTESELALNGFKVRTGRKLDWNDQFDRALKAFKDNRIILIAGDRQAESLDEVVHLRSQQDPVVFLKLVPLVGG